MQDSLDALLTQLKAEIEQAEHGDLDRAELARLARALEAHLDPEQETEDRGPIDDLRAGVRHFEASHPDLAAAIGRVADALGSMGL